MNKVFLIGNLTRDPEMRATSAGVSVCNFSIAVNRRFRNQNGQQETDFFNIVAWRQLGELCGKYLMKGRKVAVSGSIQTRTYEAQDGTRRNAFDIVADEVEFLTPAGAGAPVGEAHTAPIAPAAPVMSSAPAANPAYTAPAAPAVTPYPGQPSMQATPVYPAGAPEFTQVDDDDLPF